MPHSHLTNLRQLIGRSGRVTRFRWARYSLAVLAVGAAIGVRRWVLGPLVDHDGSPFLLLFAAVMAAAAYGGMGPGLLATALGAVSETLIASSRLMGEPITRMQLALFLLEGGLLSVLAGRLRQAIRRAAIAEATNFRLEQRILEISDDERRRIGHDLHDGLGQQLTGTALLCKALQQRMHSASAEDSQVVDQIATLVNQSIGWTRDLARGLAPLAAESADLATTLEEAAASSARVLGIKYAFECEGEPPEVPTHTTLHLYRIVQEAISNSVKHGKASNVTVTLGVENDELSLGIWDDGIGLSAKTLANPGLGLQIMRYRARMIGASIRIARTAPQGGAMVQCTLPLPRPVEEVSDDRKRTA